MILYSLTVSLRNDYTGMLPICDLFMLAPEFHIVVQAGSRGELYNLAIRGADIGGSDGIDVWGEQFRRYPVNPC